jgi:hypothetical protein
VAKGTAKMCRGCGKLEMIGEAEFYALFGELLIQAKKSIWGVNR